MRHGEEEKQEKKFGKQEFETEEKRQTKITGSGQRSVWGKGMRTEEEKEGEIDRERGRGEVQ